MAIKRYRLNAMMLALSLFVCIEPLRADSVLTNEDLQAAIDKATAIIGDGIAEVDLRNIDESLCPFFEMHGTVYIRAGQKVRLIDGILINAEGYNGPIITVQAGGFLELGNTLDIDTGYFNVTGGELLLSGFRFPHLIRGDTETIIVSDSNDSSYSNHSVINITGGSQVDMVHLSKNPDVLYAGGNSTLGGVIASSPDNSINLSGNLFYNWPIPVLIKSDTEGQNVHVNITSALDYYIQFYPPSCGIDIDNTLAVGSTDSLYTLTEKDLSHIYYFDENNPDKFTLYLEDNAIKVKVTTTAFDLQAELDRIAAADTFTYAKPDTIIIPEEGIVIDKEIIVDKKCHAVLTGGPIVIDNNINAKHVFALSGSIILKDITFDCNNNNDCLFEYYFRGGGNLNVGENTSFINCSRETPVGLFYQQKGAELFYGSESVFKTKKNVVFADEATRIFINYGSVESQDIAIDAPKSQIVHWGGTVASAGDYVIRCGTYQSVVHNTVKSLREDASSVVLIETEVAELRTGSYIGEGSRIIIKERARIMCGGDLALPTFRLEKDAWATFTGTNRLTLAGDWQDFTIGRNVVYCDVADTAKINFLKPWPSGAYPTYYKTEGAFCFADLQWIIDHPLNNTGEDDEPVNIAVPCDGLNTQKDISLAGLQALIDGSPTEECGEPSSITIHPLCTSCSATPPTIIVKPWNCGGDVDIPKGSCISLINIYVDGLGGTKRIYVYGTLIIDINVYIRNFGGYAIHVRPGGHVIYRGNGGGATGFIYNEGGRVTIEQGEMGGGSGFGVVNIDGTVEIFCGCKDKEIPTKIYGGIQNGNANGGGGTIHIYGGDIYEGGIVNHGNIYIHGGTFHSPGGKPTIENHGELHLDGGLVDGDIYTYNDLHLCGCASVTDIHLRGGQTIYITERLQIKLRIHVFVQGTFGDGSCIAIGAGGYVLTEEDLKLIEIILPDGYEWEYDKERHAIIVKESTGITSTKTGEAGNPSAIYSLQGVKVGMSDNKAAIPAGIYVMDGRKIIIEENK